MPKNTKTMGLIPDGYGLTLNYAGGKKIFFTPSRTAEGIAILLPKKILKDAWETYSDNSFSDLEKAVMKVKGSKNLTKREGLLGASEGGTVAYGTIKSRGHGGRANRNGNRTVAHTVMVKGIPKINGEILDTFDVTCSCEDYIYHSGSDEFNNPRFACAHISSAIMSYPLRKVIPSLEDSVTKCKPMLNGEPVVPFNLYERFDLVVKSLEERYIEGKKMYDIDVELMKEDIISPEFKRGIEKGIVTFNCSKNCENYPENVNYKMWLLRKKLINTGLERTGIVREFDKKCYWNFSDGERDWRLIPTEKTVNLLEVRYDDRNYNEILENYNSEWGYGLDPMRKKMSVRHLHELGNYIDTEKVGEIVSSV